MNALKILTAALLLSLLFLTSCRKDATYYCYLVFESRWGSESIIGTYADGSVRRIKRDCTRDAKYFNQEREYRDDRYDCECCWIYEDD